MPAKPPTSANVPLVSCAACSLHMVVVSHDCNSGAIFNVLIFRPSAVNVRVGHDHEILPKHPNLGSVENVVQMRNCII